MTIKTTTRKKITWIQLYWLMAMFILIGSGFLALSHPGEQLISVSSYLGLAMLLTGCINLYIYRKQRELLHGSHWLLADGMSTTLLALFPLFNQMIQPAMIPLFFGVWELFSGILKVIDASELKEEQIDGWRWFQNIGRIEILSGVSSLLKPIDDFMGIHVIVAIILFIQGLGFLFKILIYQKIKR